MIEDQARGHWGSRAEFVLSCVGYSVGLGNVWRFPFLAYENGGGAFLVPYIILLILVGKPMYFMEAALGQFGQVGPMQIWSELLPAGIGIGLAMVTISLIVSIYYNVIMAYCLFYLFNSMRAVLPWTECDPAWADARCYVRADNSSARSPLLHACHPTPFRKCPPVLEPQTSEEQYWERRVLQIRDSGFGEFGDIGQLNMELGFYLLLSWIIVLICLSKGIKSSGKVVYFSATFPYLILVILLIMGVIQTGAGDGLYFLFVPDWEKIQNFSVWRAAAGQVFFSLGISWGGIIMFGSYNKFDARVHVDAHIVSVVDFLTSLLASIVVFSTLGHSAHILGVPVETVAKGGQGLAFVAYPEALSQLPAPQFWSIIFFSMLFLLGLDSQFALVETATCAIFDAFPRLRDNKTCITSLVCAACFLLGLPCLSECGQYVLDLMDTYGAGMSVIIIAMCELIAIMWVYGVRNYCRDIKAMLGFSPSWYFKICWTVISPLALITVFVAGCVTWTRPSYGAVQYPEWAHIIGWLLFSLSVVQIPVWLLIMSLASVMEAGCGSWPTLRPTQSWTERRQQGDVSNSTFICKSSKGITEMSFQSFNPPAMEMKPKDCVLGGPNDSQFLSSSVSTGGGDSAIDIPHSSMLNSGSFASVRRAQSQGSLQSSSQARDSSYTYFNV